MDELLGGLAAAGAAIIAAVWIIQKIVEGILWLVSTALRGIGWVFVALSDLFGHPAIVLAMSLAVGALMAIVVSARRRRLAGPTGLKTTVQIRHWHLALESWVALVLGAALAILAVFGIVWY